MCLALVKAITKKLSKIPSLHFFPNLQTLDRVRRKIRNDDGHYLPTDKEVAEKRNIRAELIKQYYIEEKEIEG